MHPTWRSVMRLLAAALAAVTLSVAPAHPPAAAGAPAAGGTTLSPELARLAGVPTTQALGQRGSRPAAGPGSITRGPRGEVVVEVRLADAAAARLADVARVGSVVAVDRDRAVLTVQLPTGRLTALAAVPGVRSVREVLQPMSWAACPTGIRSEGVSQLRADLAQAAGVTGTHVTVGVLSDSYDRLGGAAADVANGELPGASNPCGHRQPVAVPAEGPVNAHDEGRAMAQIVHDIAPDARIVFRTAGGGQNAFAQAIRDLAAQGATVIVDDILYLDEPMYQDGPIAAAIADVTARGVTYLSAVGNSHYIEPFGRSAGSYETMAFRPTTCPAIVFAYYPAGTTCHNFSTTGVDPTYDIHVGRADGAPPLALYALSWSQPEFGVSTDLDLCVYNPRIDDLYSCGWDDSIRTGSAAEVAGIDQAGAAQVLVIKAGTGGANPRFKLVAPNADLTGVEYAQSAGSDVVGPTAYGHNVSEAAIAVGAVPYHNAATIEQFSSRGPAHTCWGPVRGTSPAAPVSPCRVTTVDLLATDGGANSFFGSFDGSVHRFYGTSAAAPHAAGVAALVQSAASCLTPAQVLAALRSTARPIAGYDANAQGAGLVDAARATVAPAVPSCRGRYTALPPARVLDTRSGVGGAAGPVGPGGTVTLTLPPAVPTTATAVVLNVTGVQPTASTYLTVHPGGTFAPVASNLNLTPGQILPNLVTVAVGPGRTVSVYNALGSVNVLADLQGFYAPAGGAGATLLTPARVLDTRTGTGVRRGPIGADSTVTLTVPGLPATATAVVLNVTGILPTVGTYVTAYPGGGSRPLTSNLNIEGTQVRANAVTVALGPGGTVSFYNDRGTIELAADLVGYYDTAGGASFVARPPVRVLDTRDSTGGVPGRLGPQATKTSRIPGLPANSPGAVLNVTTVLGSTASYLSVYPAGSGFGGTSTINFTANQVVPNLVVAKTGPGGGLTYYNDSGTVDVAADLAGWFVP